ncbi:MAG: IS1595 family transposase [Candidatus Edwardsbacteria bacterium]|nr:IS1595 family transposase [Candidatus Edwardsbacteria bacterium]
MKYFNTDEKCLEYLINLKWGEDGWHCSRCSYGDYSLITTRNLLRCKKCAYDESYISNTVMRGTRKPLTQWFWAIYTIATQKTGISAMELYRQMGFGSYKTAWAWLHKLRLAMIDPDRQKLNFDVEMDETYIFTGDERGRSMSGEKVLILCAVEVIKNPKKTVSGQIRLRSVESASQVNINSFVKDHVMPHSTIRTDGWKGYNGLSKIGYVHKLMRLDSPEDASKKLPRVHRVFANLQSWLIGTHKFVSKKHVQNYLNEYTTRFNARQHPIEVFNDILRLTLLAEPRTLRGFMEPERPFYPNPA